MANPNPSPETRFQEGNNANPGGRPKGRSITSRLRDVLEMAELGGKPLPGGKCVADLVVESLVKQVLKGNPQCINMLLERVEGKVLDKLDVTSDGKPLQPIFRRIDNGRDAGVRPPASTNGVCHE